ncbi:MAG: hypothetical protein N3D84_03225, partial [Candidatus Woesearchaeota archaeon]|nr:hypothetical protein [Candidatus Woesearchaeota archaeon]
MFHPGLMILSISSNSNLAVERVQYSISEMSKDNLEIKRGYLIANIYEQLEPRLHPLCNHVKFDNGEREEVKPTKKQKIESLKDYLEVCMDFSERMNREKDYESAYYSLTAFYNVSCNFLADKEINALFDKETLKVIEEVRDDVFALAYCYATMDSIKKEGNTISKEVQDYRREIERRIENNIAMLDIIMAEESAKGVPLENKLLETLPLPKIEYRKNTCYNKNE